MCGEYLELIQSINNDKFTKNHKMLINLTFMKIIYNQIKLKIYLYKWIKKIFLIYLKIFIFSGYFNFIFWKIFYGSYPFWL